MKKIKFNKFKKSLLVILSIVLIFVIYKYKQNENRDIFIPVLMYHNIDTNPDFKKITYTMKPARFEKHMIALKKSGYNTITATELNEYISNNIDLPKKPILLTFDDGKTNNYEYAYPVLKRLDMKATMFAIVHTAEDNKNKAYLDWDRLKEMHDEGVMDIQSHTYDLHHKSDDRPVIFKEIEEQSEDDYKDRILNDFNLSRELIEKNLGNRAIALAYPYGEYNDYVEDLAKQAGYEQTYTTDLGVMKRSDSPYLIKRINIDGLCSERRLLIEIDLFKLLTSVF